jgi:hypothetical protein
MRNGGKKNCLAGTEGSFLGERRDRGPPEHPGPQRAVERGAGGVRAEGTSVNHGLPVWLVVSDNPEIG